MSGLMLFAFLFLLAMSVPVAISIGLGSTAAVFGTDNLSMIVIAQQLFIAIDKYPLAAIPFFILAVNLWKRLGKVLFLAHWQGLHKSKSLKRGYIVRY